MVDFLRAVEHVHGHLGWLAAASLVHPAILLRDRRRRAHLAVVSSVALVTIVGAIGAWLYGPYRDVVKQPLFVEARGVGLLFERKEHLAFGAIAFAWCAAIAYFSADRVEKELRAPLRTIAFYAFAAASGLALVAATFGTIVAITRTF